MISCARPFSAWSLCRYGLGAVAVLATQGAAWASTIYVTQGAVAGNGTAAHPFGTIQAGASAAHPGDTVLVAAGVYRETVVMPSSGTAAAPITIKSAIPGAAVITGSNPVGPFTQVSGSSSWSASVVPAFSSAENQGEQCFAGNTRLIAARWPFTPAASLSSPAFAQVEGVSGDSIVGIKYGDMRIHVVTITDSHLPQINWTGATIRIFLANGYQQVTGTVLSSSGTSLTIRYATKTGDLVVPFVQYFLYGVPMALNNAGEWERSGSGILVRAPGDANPNQAQIECKQRDYAFDLTFQSYVTVDGFTIEHANVTTDRYAYMVRTGNSVAPANHIVFNNLNVDTPNSIADLSANPYSQWTNNTGVVLSGSYNVLQNSQIMHADGNGVSLAGIGNKVLNNFISESDLVGTECAGISTGFNGLNANVQGQIVRTYNMDEEIAYNTIERSGRALINPSTLGASQPSASRIHHNVLSGAVLQTYDNGAIYSIQYLAGQTFQQGVEIDHNQITASPVAIYLDQYSSGFLVHHNVASGPGEPSGQIIDAMMITNSGTNHLVANNTLIAEYPNIYGIYDWPGPGNTTDSGQGMVVRNNILYGGIHLGTTAAADHNLIWDGTSGSATDPLLQNLLTGNFSLTANSPAINQGLTIAGVTDDTRPGAQPVIGLPDLGAIEWGTTSWIPALPADSMPPAVVLTTPANGATYAYHQFVRPSYSCTDGLGGSGVTRCTGTSRNRGWIDTLSPGVKTYTVTATDRAGNTTVVVSRYTVVCPTGGC